METLIKEEVKLTKDQKRLVEENINLVYGYFFKFLIEEEKCEFAQNEIKSNLFQSLCLAARKFDPTRNIKFSTYAYRTMALNYIRERNKKVKYNNYHTNLYDEICIDEEYIPVFISKVNWDKLEILFRRAGLTLIQKRTIKLYYKEGMNLRQIAMKEDMTYQAVHWRLIKAREKMRKYIKNRKESMDNFYKEEWE